MAYGIATRTPATAEKQDTQNHSPRLIGRIAKSRNRTPLWHVSRKGILEGEVTRAQVARYYYVGVLGVHHKGGTEVDTL